MRFDFWAKDPLGLQGHLDNLVLPVLRQGKDVAIQFHRISFLDPRTDTEVVAGTQADGEAAARGIAEEREGRMSLFPLVTWERIENRRADEALTNWGHYLGPCNRPFGKQSFGLYVLSQLAAVAVSASPVAPTCAGLPRTTIVELARLCAHPDHRDMTRVALRLWRKTAAEEWSRAHWPVQAYVSYARKDLHTGDIYRFDGWERAKDARASVVTAGSHHSTPGVIHAKSVWVWRLSA